MINRFKVSTNYTKTVYEVRQGDYTQWIDRRPDLQYVLKGKVDGCGIDFLTKGTLAYCHKNLYKA
jgi:hypothetical protein